MKPLSKEERALDPASAREQFPALREKTFLDAACVSLTPQTAVDAIQTFLQRALTCPEVSATRHHITLDEWRAQARPEAARLVNAAPEEIALVESTTHGLNLTARAIPLERGDRVLLCDLEFLQVALPWHQMRQETGIGIDMVAHTDGAVRTEDIADRITSRTRVVSLSSVQWSNGYRCDLPALARLCRERKIWLVVDAIQQLGAVPINVRETPVDFIACGGHKWLNAPFGTGFVYVNPARREALRNPLAGYLSLEPPKGGWAVYFETPDISPLREYDFVNDARRLEIGGTANYPGAIGLAASLPLLNKLGGTQIADYIFKLTDRLISGLQTLKVRVLTPNEPERRAGIVTLDLGSVGRNRALLNNLLQEKILVSLRYTSNVGGIRASCHFYNSFEDIDKLLNVVEHFLSKDAL